MFFRNLRELVRMLVGFELVVSDNSLILLNDDLSFTNLFAIKIFLILDLLI